MGENTAVFVFSLIRVPAVMPILQLTFSKSFSSPNLHVFISNMNSKLDELTLLQLYVIATKYFHDWIDFGIHN